jgi:hypothetical protein
MSKTSELIKGFRYNVKHGYPTNLQYRNDGTMHLNCDNDMGFVGLAQNPLTHTTVMIYEDPITQQKPEGKACLLHKMESLPDGIERWKVCFEGDDGGVYERNIKVR